MPIGMCRKSVSADLGPQPSPPSPPSRDACDRLRSLVALPYIDDTHRLQFYRLATLRAIILSDSSNDYRSLLLPDYQRKLESKQFRRANWSKFWLCLCRCFRGLCSRWKRSFMGSNNWLEIGFEFGFFSVALTRTSKKGRLSLMLLLCFWKAMADRKS